MKLVISDPKTAKAYSKDIGEEAAAFFGKKIGEEIDLAKAGLEGYTAVITGGSDKQGFPMRQDIQGTSRRKALLSGRPGFKPERKGEKRRINVRGNTISGEIMQLNLKVAKEGSRKLSELLGTVEKKEEKKEEKAKEAPKEAKREEKKAEVKEEKKPEAKKG
jgi:small subunit ribosomal protein S6e